MLSQAMDKQASASMDAVVCVVGLTHVSSLQVMTKRQFEAHVPPAVKSPFHLPSGVINPACLPPERKPRGWCIDWTNGTARQASPAVRTCCSLCKREYSELLICFGGFCRYRFVCSACSVPSQRLACYKCRHVCKREPGCGDLAELCTRVTCIKCWEVNVHYENQWDLGQWQRTII